MRPESRERPEGWDDGLVTTTPLPVVAAVPSGRARARTALRRAWSPRGWRPGADGRAVLALLAAAALWVLGFWGADPRAMTDLGMLSLFTAPVAAGLVLLVTSFVLALRRHAREWVLGAHVVTLVLLVHGTPAVLFGTLRYSWAWKHVGIVDYILRTGSVDTTIQALSIYHNWPGFFAGSALLTDLVGEQSALTLAVWAPVAFNLGNLLALRFVVRGLTDDRRLVWLSVWLYFVTTWVGQDYFSPQAMAFLLYLFLIGLGLRVLRIARRRRAVAPASTVVGGSAVSRPAVLVVMVLVMAVIASSHQVTPLMMVMTLVALCVLRQFRGWYVPVLAVAVTVGWAVTVARGYTVPHVTDLVTGLGEPTQNAQQTFAKAEHLSGAQILVSRGGRAVTGLAGLAAVVGLVRLLMRRNLDLAAVVLMALPVTLLFVTGFDGEALFRVVLFSAPFVAYFAAAAVYPGPPKQPGPVAESRRALAAAVLVVALLPGFLLGYYGKDQANYFPPDEVAAARYVYAHGPPGSLLVEGTQNYPHQFLDYERFVYVPIVGEPEASRARIERHPAAVLFEWLDDPRYRSGYVLITRGQKIDAATSGSLPRGFLDRVEARLRVSPWFRVAYETPDGVVFELSRAGRNR